MVTPETTGKRYMEELDPVEFIAVLEEGSRKFNEECDRLGISRVIAIDGKPALYHADGTHTFLPDELLGDSAAMQAFLSNYKVFSKHAKCP